MDTEKATRWLTLAANAGVLAGLVGVAIQINQNTAITKAQLANQEPQWRKWSFKDSSGVVHHGEGWDLQLFKNPT